MSNKKQIQPLRRFPKFQKDPAWNTETLGKLAKRIKKKNNGNMVSRVLTNSAVDGVVDQRDYFDKDIANKSNLEGYFILEEGDYVYNPRTSTSAPVGPISKNKLGTGVMSPLYTVFRFKEKNNDFYEQYFKSTHWHQYMYKISNTGARHDRMSITNDQFMEMPLPYPKPEEQKKIADCLSSIDELIGLETKKLDALKGHKTGLTQQLFPNEGEPLPKFRFSEFRNASKWTIKSGGDLFAQISNKNHDSNLPILAITQEHGAIPRDQINYHVSVSEKSIESYKIVEIGDFIISLRSFQGGIEYSKYKGLCSPAYVILRNKTKALNCYFKHFFKTERFIRDMTKNIEGLRDGKMVSYKQFSELMLPFPSSENEQRKIAECLSTADEMVAAQFQIVETLKEHKKGLMQQLFPPAEEVVGWNDFATINDVAVHLRSELKDKKYLAVFAYNGTGKTRLSMAFKNLGKTEDTSDTLYFNAFTEDLFSWDNDLDGDSERVLKLNSKSRFFAGLDELEMNNRIRPFLHRYADFYFEINYEDWTVSFSREIHIPSPDGGEPKTEIFENIKISRGEESLFIWCFFLAIAQLALDGAEAYKWVKYIYIDDPISSLDENNTIALAHHLAQLLKRKDHDIKTVISSHHALFFNVMWNELRDERKKFYPYFLSYSAKNHNYTLRYTGDTPFFHHVATLIELYQAAETGELYTHHFNTLRTILEKSACFHGFNKFSALIQKDEDDPDGVLYTRLINVLNHGNYSLYEPREMLEENKDQFKKILGSFLNNYNFNPELFPKVQEES